jgi:FKBP-type peptidyl-prolyl cis-trans isomerase
LLQKKAYFATKATATTTPSGLTYKIVQKGRYKPIDGSTFIFTAGYFEDGNLFDSSYEDK